MEKAFTYRTAVLVSVEGLSALPSLQLAIKPRTCTIEPAEASFSPWLQVRSAHESRFHSQLFHNFQQRLGVQEPENPTASGLRTPVPAPAAPCLRLCSLDPEQQHQVSTVKLSTSHLTEQPCPVVEQMQNPKPYSRPGLAWNSVIRPPPSSECHQA